MLPGCLSWCLATARHLNEILCESCCCGSFQCGLESSRAQREQGYGWSVKVLLEIPTKAGVCSCILNSHLQAQDCSLLVQNPLGFCTACLTAKGFNTISCPALILSETFSFVVLYDLLMRASIFPAFLHGSHFMYSNENQMTQMWKLLYWWYKTSLINVSKRISFLKRAIINRQRGMCCLIQKELFFNWSWTIHERKIKTIEKQEKCSASTLIFPYCKRNELLIFFFHVISIHFSRIFIPQEAASQVDM